MRTIETKLGRVCVGATEELFAELARMGAEAWRAAGRGGFGWALTGGSTPKAWYRWCVERRALAPELVAGAHWFTSDERCVPLASDESNFGNAARLLLDPLGVPAERRHRWPVELPPPAAAERFARDCDVALGVGRGFQLCTLGLGDDAHTASFFPGSPLLVAPPAARFAAVEVPGKGWRLTLTPAGLASCGRIVVHATGAAKAAAIRRIFCGDEPLLAVPAKVLEPLAARTTWLLDPAAVAECPELRG
jgi:6-phosphogluconolactonase